MTGLFWKQYCINRNPEGALQFLKPDVMAVALMEVASSLIVTSFRHTPIPEKRH
jgi:hypothetical protein